MGGAGFRDDSHSRPLRARIRDGETVFGPFMKLASPQIVEIAGRAGFDFVIIDMEHGPLGADDVENLVRAAEGAGIAAVVRVYDNSPALIARALDVGAQGVLVPHVSSAREAQLLAKAARFAPEGERGVCRFVRAAEFSAKDRWTYFREANERTLVVAMIEGMEGIASLDEILGVPGLDVVFVGPYDLSQAMGLTGQVSDPRVASEMQRVVDRARSRGVAVGTFVDDVEGARRWEALGVQFVSYSVDVGIIYEAMRDSVSRLLRRDKA